jgi:hypothetical protein
MFEMLRSAYDKECLLRTSVSEWHKRLEEGRELLQYDERKGRPSTSGSYSKEYGRRSSFEYPDVRRTKLIAIRPEFQESGSWHLLHNNAKTHYLGVVSGFLTKREIPVLSLTPYSPD